MRQVREKTLQQPHKHKSTSLGKRDVDEKSFFTPRETQEATKHEAGERKNSATAA